MARHERRRHGALVSRHARALPVVTDKPVQREWAFQRMCNAFLSRALPPTAYVTAIDIGSAGSARQGMLRRARGVLPGIADILIVHDGTTLWVELKAGSSLSPAQKMFRERITANGHLWALARTTEELEAALIDAGIPLRATVTGIRDRIAEQNERLPKKRPRAKAPRPLNAMSVARYHRLNRKGLL
jgi:hypothetical protein